VFLGQRGVLTLIVIVCLGSDSAFWSVKALVVEFGSSGATPRAMSCSINAAE
jgi:hypothetical protein